MKKILGLLILCFTLVIFTGCGAKDDEGASDTKKTAIEDNADNDKVSNEETSEEDVAYQTLKDMNEDNLSAIEVLLKEDISEEELSNAIELCDQIIGTNITSSNEDLGVAYKNIYIAAQNTKTLAETIVKISGGENTYQKQNYIDTSMEKINNATEHLENYNSK